MSYVFCKVFESKQWNDCLLNLLANTDDEIVLRGAVIVQHMVAVNKEIAEKILETQVIGHLHIVHQLRNIYFSGDGGVTSTCPQSQP